MRFELSIIVPCFNEELNVSPLFERLLKVIEKLNVNSEIIFVNDCSKDGTLKTLRQLQRKKTKCPLVIIDNKKNVGIFQSWKAGLELARGNYVVFIDADLQNLPEDIYRLYKGIVGSGYDLVQGYRSSIGRIKESRFILSKGLNFLLNLLFNMNLKDNKSGFFIAPKYILKTIFSYRFRYYYPHTFIAISANSKNMRINQIETIFNSRVYGKSFLPNFPIKTVCKCIVDIFFALYEFRIRKDKNYYLHNFIESNNLQKKKFFFDPSDLWLRFYCFTIPLHGWLISRDIYKYYHDLKVTQFCTKNQIEKIQLEKLRALLEHSYNHVEYYKELFDSVNFKPSDLISLSDLRKVPLLDKAIVRKNIYSGLLSDNHDKKKIYKISTSGSTGEPFECYVDKFQLEMRWAATLRSQEWTGYKFGDKCARLWHQTIGMSFIQIVKEKLDAILSRRIFIPAFDMDNKKLNLYMNKLNKYKPSFIDGYAESFNFFSQYAATNKIKLDLKGIMTSAQIMPQHVKNKIEKQFNCKVYDKYGAREFSGIAYEDGTNTDHLVVSENYIIEIIKNGKPAKKDEDGEVVITDLNNYCMPFIRYRIGDIATNSRIDCSKSLRPGLFRIGVVKGRTQAIIFGHDNIYFPGAFFYHFFKDYEYLIKQFQIIQSKKGEIDLKIVKGSMFNKSELSSVLNDLKKYLGKKFIIKISIVDNIDLGRTGKRQGIVSHLKYDFQEILNG